MNRIRSIIRTINRYTLITLNPQLDHYRAGRSIDVR